MLPWFWVCDGAGCEAMQSKPTVIAKHDAVIGYLLESTALTMDVRGDSTEVAAASATASQLHLNVSWMCRRWFVILGLDSPLLVL